jgi:hypothetical protein
LYCLCLLAIPSITPSITRGLGCLYISSFIFHALTWRDDVPCQLIHYNSFKMRLFSRIDLFVSWTKNFRHRITFNIKPFFFNIYIKQLACKKLDLYTYE